MSADKTQGLLDGLVKFATIATIPALAAGCYRNRWAAARRLYNQKYPRMAESLRKTDVTLISRKIKESQPASETYVVVCGPKGVGKSTAVGTAMADMHGVLRITVQPEMSVKDILDEVYSSLWPHMYIGVLAYQREHAARNVLKAYSQFCNPPWVVFDIVGEKGVVSPKPFSAARSLCKTGVNVLIDASEGLLGPSLDERAQPVYLDYMLWETMEHIPRLKQCMKILYDNNLDAKVKEVIGGCPLELIQLTGVVSPGASLGETKKLIRNWLEPKVIRAAVDIAQVMAQTPAAKEVLDAFETEKQYPVEQCPVPPEKIIMVLRERKGFYIPRRQAVAFALRHKIKASEVPAFMEAWF